jgi:hypothetical protein
VVRVLKLQKARPTRLLLRAADPHPLFSHEEENTDMHDGGSREKLKD